VCAFGYKVSEKDDGWQLNFLLGKFNDLRIALGRKVSAVRRVSVGLSLDLKKVGTSVPTLGLFDLWIR